ncbi:hypothetical protein BU25DRAFT_351242 [Macroventuria anomochaeta]|uniref:Uncharacterized protein n=1 Tax=Macroventuria anomochaeta TaxID=301207 RepID=A0ACB6RMC4_9PLEO|nr:uncharacterized protein BU25DRAFT_351242 [Macroventuria anomochaeta]KAF2622888.1 hypothetical protein BU25DRAFT_351242 [Macroventuria anomochaeta]
MSDDWFSHKLYPYGDGNTEDRCHPEEAQALKDYLHHRKASIEAARATTHPISVAVNPKDDFHRLWGPLIDAFMELPREHTEPLIALLQATKDLPDPEVIAKNSGRHDDSFWEESQGFGNLWSDVVAVSVDMYPTYLWRSIVEPTKGERRDILRVDHARRAEVEARLVTVGLAGIRIDWGYEAVVDALESSNATLDFEIPVMAEWLVICGKQLWGGARMNKKSWGLKARDRDPLKDLWRKNDD